MKEMNPIEEFILESDVDVMYEIAVDFGQDIAQSFVRLADKIQNDGKKRDCYGIVLKANGAMQYRAAFNELYEGEAESLGIPSFQIEKGKYWAIKIEQWNQKLLEIGPTFDQILKSGKVDTNSPCIEYYHTESDLICMVKSLDN